jgi:drug/metabolite transporter, DME family
MSPQALALVTSVSYAGALICSRLGLKYSTPTTVTLVSILVQNLVLWTAVFFLSGIPPVSLVSVTLFGIVGVFQLGVRLLAYTGVLKIGASRSSALQSINPLISFTIAIVVLKESATVLTLAGTLLVVAGVVLVSWRAEQELLSFRWWHLLLPIGAAILSGVNHPMRRYALNLSNEPLFFSAFMGFVTLIAFAGYMTISSQEPRLVWDRRALWPFVCTGIFETFSIFLIIKALSIGPVVVIAPIAATYPVWSLIGAKLFLKDVERIGLKAAVGILSVVAGTVAIHLGR